MVIEISLPPKEYSASTTAPRKARSKADQLASSAYYCQRTLIPSSRGSRTAPKNSRNVLKMLQMLKNPTFANRLQERNIHFIFVVDIHCASYPQSKDDGAWIRLEIFIDSTHSIMQQFFFADEILADSLNVTRPKRRLHKLPFPILLHQPNDYITRPLSPRRRHAQIAHRFPRLRTETLHSGNLGRFPRRDVMAVTFGNGHQEEKKGEDDGEDRDDEPRPLDVKV